MISTFHGPFHVGTLTKIEPDCLTWFRIRDSAADQLGRGHLWKTEFRKRLIASSESKFRGCPPIGISPMADLQPFFVADKRLPASENTKSYPGQSSPVIRRIAS